MRPRAALIDVLGTVLDEDAGFRAAATVIDPPLADPDAFAARWVAGTSDTVAGIAAGRVPWRPWERVIAETLTTMLPATGPGGSAGSGAEASAVGRRLPPWPDSRAGLEALRAGCAVVALSNAGLGPLMDCFRAGGLTWDAVLSAEMVRSTKPDPRVYRFALDALGVDPSEVVMVAAHPWDLRAAASHGMRTAFLRRPGGDEPDADDAFDWVADDLVQLADVLAAA